MSVECFNCLEQMAPDLIVCPSCHAIQKQRFSRDDLFDFLAITHPTKPTAKFRVISTKKGIMTRSYSEWLIIGLCTFGFGYLYYLLLTLIDMNDQWYFPHGKKETTTNNDILTAMILLFTINWFSVPLIQYTRYKKFRTHLQNAPKDCDPKLPAKPWVISLIQSSQLFFVLGLATLLFFGISSEVAGWLFQFDSNFVTILFFLGAAACFVIIGLLGAQVAILDRKWQKEFNKHANWHLSRHASKSRQ